MRVDDFDEFLPFEGGFWSKLKILGFFEQIMKPPGLIICQIIRL
jgi:hypothetical protein